MHNLLHMLLHLVFRHLSLLQLAMCKVSKDATVVPQLHQSNCNCMKESHIHRVDLKKFLYQYRRTKMDFSLFRMDYLQKRPLWTCVECQEYNIYGYPFVVMVVCHFMAIGSLPCHICGVITGYAYAYGLFDVLQREYVFLSKWETCLYWNLHPVVRLRRYRKFVSCTTCRHTSDVLAHIPISYILQVNAHNVFQQAPLDAEDLEPKIDMMINAEFFLETELRKKTHTTQDCYTMGFFGISENNDLPSQKCSFLVTLVSWLSLFKDGNLHMILVFLFSWALIIWVSFSLMFSMIYVGTICFSELVFLFRQWMLLLDANGTG